MSEPFIFFIVSILYLAADNKVTDSDQYTIIPCNLIRVLPPCSTLTQIDCSSEYRVKSQI